MDRAVQLVGLLQPALDLEGTLHVRQQPFQPLRFVDRKIPGVARAMDAEGGMPAAVHRHDGPDQVIDADLPQILVVNEAPLELSLQDDVGADRCPAEQPLLDVAVGPHVVRRELRVELKAFRAQARRAEDTDLAGLRMMRRQHQVWPPTWLSRPWVTSDHGRHPSAAS
jgi:hypothetical protein